jgi:predicted HAD superfamily Cof-like phosphohydrolase
MQGRKIGVTKAEKFSALVERVTTSHPTTLRGQVTEFHIDNGHPVIMGRPAVPSDDRVRLRLRLIAEEFLELLEACGVDIDPLWDAVSDQIHGSVVDVDLPALADAMADLDYVVEGTRLECGIDGAPIAAAVHASNMQKRGGPIDEHGKQGKPFGWQPPDIAAELRRQGWKP